MRNLTRDVGTEPGRRGDERRSRSKSVINSRNGPMAFAEFMSRALYDPAHGYYSRAHKQIGKRGDFFTSVSVGSFFGELLAFQFARWVEALSKSQTVFQIVEAGAHDGQLALDILGAMAAHESALFKSVEYWIIEPSNARRVTQQATLSRFPERSLV